MRDPRGPIPSPYHQGTRSSTFWERPAPPPQATGGTVLESTEPDEYDPTRLLHGGQADTDGIDRRTQRRDLGRSGHAHGVHQVMAARHRRIDAVLALSASTGWVLVRTLSLAPGGILLHLLDLLDPDLEPSERAHGQAMLLRLAPVLGAPLRPRHLEAAASANDPGDPAHPSHAGGSLLATVGQCVLARRLVADLSSWSSRTGGRRSSRVAPSSALAVSLVVPSSHTVSPGQSASRAGLVTIPGELLPLTDPQPQVLAVGLDAAAAAQLELTLRHQRDPERGRRRPGRTPTMP